MISRSDAEGTPKGGCRVPRGDSAPKRSLVGCFEGEGGLDLTSDISKWSVRAPYNW